MYTKTPDAVIDWLRTSSREEIIHQHLISIGAKWWNDQKDQVPGLPLSYSHIDGEPQLSRGDVFKLAKLIKTESDGTAALRLLWHVLAWGTGRTQRNNSQRIKAVMEDLETAKQLLAEAAITSRHDALEAFKLFRSGHSNAIGHLGPNFFTKYLYFAGAGNSTHPCIIVDAQVRATLYSVSNKEDKRFAPLSQYSASHYQEALECITNWAEDAAKELGRPVAIDEIERWAFGR